MCILIINFCIKNYLNNSNVMIFSSTARMCSYSTQDICMYYIEFSRDLNEMVSYGFYNFYMI